MQAWRIVSDLEATEVAWERSTNVNTCLSMGGRKNSRRSSRHRSLQCCRHPGHRRSEIEGQPPPNSQRAEGKATDSAEGKKPVVLVEVGHCGERRKERKGESEWRGLSVQAVGCVVVEGRTGKRPKSLLRRRNDSLMQRA